MPIEAENSRWLQSKRGKKKNKILGVVMGIASFSRQVCQYVG
ncbi:hypothetical protein M069_4640 [Bacteroides fragilis str. B1 (UDC16-1)]|jgi:hypothetical protein|nr:hypothetical protein M069_4640 [Bacteroides fragilis str. B1 (UDC16-1)]